MQIEPSTFERLRGFRIKITIRNTALTSFPSNILQYMSGISFLNLVLIHNNIKTFNPFTSEIAIKPPMLNRQGTILESIDLRVI